MPVDTFLNLLKNIVDKNKPLVYSRFNETIWTVSDLYTYKDIVYLHTGISNKLTIRDIAAYILNHKSVYRVGIVTPIGSFKDIKDITNTGFIYVI